MFERFELWKNRKISLDTLIKYDNIPSMTSFLANLTVRNIALIKGKFALRNSKG